MLVAQVAEVSGIQYIQHAFLAAAKHEMRAWDQSCARGVQIGILSIQRKVIRWCEPIDKAQLGSNLQKAFAEVSYTVPTPITSHHVHVPLFIDRRPLPGLPDTRFRTRRRRIQHVYLRKRLCVVRHQKPVIRLLVAMRRVTDIHHAVSQRQSWPLVLHQRIETWGADNNRTHW